jgi:hypothetical protein
MEEKNKGLNINIEHYTGEKPIEVVYRLGDAAQAQQPLATKAPEKISVSGTISTPYEWLSKRIDTVDQKRANVVVNREKMTIQLTVNEDDYYNKNTFTGSVEVSETFEKFGINDGEKGWIACIKPIFSNGSFHWLTASNIDAFQLSGKQLST